MGYLFLALAIIGELIGTTLLKYSEGFTKLIPATGCVLAYVACFYFFSKCLTSINLSVAYATWSGVGIIAATLLSVYIFKEKIDLIGFVGILLIVVGAVLLNFFSASSVQ